MARTRDVEPTDTETRDSISNFVLNFRNMSSSESKTLTRRREQKITEKVH